MNLCQESVKVSELLARKGFKKEDLERIEELYRTEFHAQSILQQPQAATITSSAIKSITTNKDSANQNDTGNIGDS